jgi:Kef-type K+ transport system membrane component KefB
MRTILLYIAMLVAGVALFLWIEQWGLTLVAPEVSASVATRAEAAGAANPLVHVLMTLAAVLALGWLLGYLFRFISQPPVIGEVVAGIVLGPSILGAIIPGATEFLLPASAAPYLGVIAQLGIVLYMFLIGLELNLGELRGRGRATLMISHASIVIPFVLGAAVALYLYPRYSSQDVRFTSFALFLGVAMSITAFPVLARILSDRGMQTTPLGVMALACAAINDATAWCLLAFVVGVAQAKVGEALAIAAMTVGFIAFMFLIARPIAVRLFAHFDRNDATRGATALIFVALLLSALATETIGDHAIFGAFLLGAVIPHDSIVAQRFAHKLEDVVTVLMLPAFFALTGMRTQIGLLSEWNDWAICLMIIVVATLGKFGGTWLAARAYGNSWREASALGLLMNTRGLMELIVLNVGLELHVISPTLFAMMVLMALATTIVTAPLLSILGIPAKANARA